MAWRADEDKVTLKRSAHGKTKHPVLHVASQSTGRSGGVYIYLTPGGIGARSWKEHASTVTPGRTYACEYAWCFGGGTNTLYNLLQGILDLDLRVNTSVRYGTFGAGIKVQRPGYTRPLHRLLPCLTIRLTSDNVMSFRHVRSRPGLARVLSTFFDPRAPGLACIR